eukprot:CAMPEP_0182597490 /NCGR_PEP_ID=MMETSP1324-20130603/86343_1 /TAXON_ID=236786 /ORGANISM="Florenciella sp., Strain RCC1587" /LENGTH=37 /DNA_ID= /DNA_START= /DNA_END= /DNA_ORIENTATION=
MPLLRCWPSVVLASDTVFDAAASRIMVVAMAASPLVE